ncbi:unnamed protein product [Toxocara canis]|uniref:LAM_G_DOMAIN domain-containing protein n=1 Tax=Toxocara canis TaxID=6265 RepID=A0A183V160_TOXCA|nr:unnamed protein product [Toxocara canis]
MSKFPDVGMVDKDIKSLNVSWDQYIAYEISEKESQPHIISIDFKTMVKEGVLIHGSVLSATDDEPIGDLKLALIYGQLRLTIGDFIEVNFYNVSLTSENFHEIVLSFDYGTSEVQLSLDGDAKTASWYEPGKDVDIRFGKELFFSAGGSEVGLSGCLRQIYVGYFDVIAGYLSNSSKVTASHELQSCDMNTVALVPDLYLLSPVHGDGIIEGNGNPTEGLWAYEQKQKILPHDEEENLDADAEAISHKIEDEISAAVDTSKAVEDPIHDHNIPEKFVVGKILRTVLWGAIVNNRMLESGTTLPWNCHDVLTSGNTEPGTYVIDVDGSGPLLETYVYCRNGQTIVPHNMPNGTLMHSSNLGDLRLRINYRLFSEDQLRHLREFSQECSQTMRYDCQNAPLGFSWRKTWLTSLYDHEFSQLMDPDGSCQCVNGQCGKCNCDGGGVNSDYGTLSGINVPITNIYALNDPTDLKGVVSLTPLVCSGSAGYAQTHTATFRSRADSLALGDWNARSLSFEFRTFKNDVTIISSRDAKLELELQDRSLYLLIDGLNMTLTPQSRLNDGKWHRVLIEVIENMVRLSANESAEYVQLGRPLSFTKIPLFVGGGRKGFLGCIRQFVLNSGKLLNVQSLLIHEGNIRLGCEDKCATHACQHESKCEQDFEKDTVRCVCRNNIIHSGSLCENSINKGSEVSLHNSKRGFLKIQKLSNGDAIKQRIVVSVRTDRRDALFVYMHDHLYNFLQIHLSDYTRIVLTTNYNRTVRRCEVVAKVGHEFSRMQWLQIILFQDEDRVQLNVDDEVCEITGARTLSENFITKFEIDSDMEDVVEPPVTPLKREDDNRPFTLLFIGGVPTENYKGKLDPTYKTTVPTLLGCIRGLMIGDEVVDLRDHAFWPYYPQETDFVRVGCTTGCETIEPTCMNDGHCTFKWTNTDPSAVLATCDCTRASYYGEHYSGARFDGNSLLRFNAGEVIEQAIYDWSKIGQQTFDFAFAAKTDSARPQHLVTVHFSHSRLVDTT